MPGSGIDAVFFVLLVMTIPLMILVLAIVFVKAHKRMAIAQEEMANAHIEIAKQLGSIATQLRNREL